MRHSSVNYELNLETGKLGLRPRGFPNDTLGIGCARTQLSGNFVPFIRRRLDLGVSVSGLRMYLRF